MRFLLFQLHGPLASWGDIAVGDTRPSGSHPSRSALVGLLGACLGIEREDREGQESVRDSYAFGVEEWRMGEALWDFHTAQVPVRARVRSAVKEGMPVRTRRAALSLPDPRTILTRREYRTDGFWRVAVQARDGETPWSLESMAAALCRPVFTPYLGRRACPAALPFEPTVVEAESMVAAFRAAPSVVMEMIPGDRSGKGSGSGLSGLATSLGHGPSRYYWEDGLNAGLDAEQVVECRDEPRSRTRHLFGLRREHQASAPGEVR